MGFKHDFSVPRIGVSHFCVREVGNSSLQKTPGSSSGGGQAWN